LIDTLTVNETASEPPPEDGTMDSAKNLGMEAVFINHNFPQQVLKMVSSYLLNQSMNQSIL
jgi:translation initiation factor 3 subunit D